MPVAVNPSPALPARKGGWRSCRFASHLDSPLPCTETVRVTDTETEQVLQNGPLSGSQRETTVRFAVPDGWRIRSIDVRRVDRSVSGRTLSRPLWTWQVACVGPRKAVRRAAGRSKTREWAVKRAQRALWRLTGTRRGLNRCHPVPGRRSRAAPLVVVDCAGERWTAGGRASNPTTAVRSVVALGVPVRPGTRWAGAAARLGWASGALGTVESGDVPQEERGARCVWVVRVSRAQRDQVRKLATSPRPPLGPSSPFRAPVLSRWTVPVPSPALDDDDDAGMQVDDAGDDCAWGQ